VSRRPPTREERMAERLADKLDRLRSDLPPERDPGVVRPKKRIVADGDLPRWDYRRNQ
jgi:hypothetical protein